MSFYDLEFRDTAWRTIKMKDYKGKVVLIVNTATKCGLAPQFKELESLYQKYKDKNFTIIGFPSAQFANQEPETNETLVQACKVNFGVTFLLSEKIDVNGKNTHPVFEYLKANAKGGVFGKNIKWNFTKFLVSADGKSITRYAPTTTPFSMEKDVVELLEK